MSGPFEAFLSQAASDCVNAVRYPEEPTRCGECGQRTETWVRVWVSEQDRRPVCLPCANLLGWAPAPEQSR